MVLPTGLVDRPQNISIHGPLLLTTPQALHSFPPVYNGIHTTTADPIKSFVCVCGPARVNSEEVQWEDLHDLKHSKW